MEIKQEIKRLNKQFLHSSDFVAKEIKLGKEENVILCYYSSLVNKKDVEQSLINLKQLNGSSSQEDQEKNQHTDKPKQSDTEDNEIDKDDAQNKEISGTKINNDYSFMK